MANSRWEYVRSFESDDALLPDTWIVVRIDGRGFHKFSDHYRFEKPNDARAINLMNAAAVATMKELPDLIIAYGVSDEFSFVFHRYCQLFDRRSSKLVTTVVSTFTAHYIFLWSTYFPTAPLQADLLPSFDGRAVLYPSITTLRDYMSWRQADCHINNLYNTTFWSLVQHGGMTNTESEKRLQGTVSSDKNEILFSQFGINYNNEPEIYKKGSVLYREYELESPSNSETPVHPSFAEDEGRFSEVLSRSKADKLRKLRNKAPVVVRHIDIIKDGFWNERPWILSGKPGKPLKKS